MTYQELKNIIQPVNQLLNLQETQFPDSGIALLFQNFFKSTSISIEEASAVPDDENEKIKLTGKFTNTFFDFAKLNSIEVRLQAIFSLLGDTPEAKITFTFVGAWNLSEALNETLFGDILADLEIDANGLLAHPITRVEVDSGTQFFKFAINPEIDLDFNDIPQYLKGASVSEDFPDTDFPSFNQTLTFSSFEFSAGIQSLLLTSIGLVVTIKDKTTSWKSMGDRLHFKALSAHFFLMNPLADPIVNIEIQATTTVADTDIIGKVFLPSLDFQVYLKPGDTVNFKGLLEDIVDNTVPSMPAITCTTFGVIGSPEVSRYEIFSTITDVMEIDIGTSKIKLEKLSGDFVFVTQPKNQAGGSLKGKIAFNSAEFSVAAASLGQDSGWQISGRTVEDQVLPIGELIARDLKDIFGVEAENIPGPLKDLTIKDLSISFNTKTHDFTFGCEGDFPVEGKQVAVILNILLTKQEDGTYKKDFEGIIDLGPFTEAGILEFDLHFIQDTSATLFAATFSHKNAPLDIKLADIITALSSNIADIPIDLSVDLKDIILVFEKKQNESSKFLFALDIGASVNLSHLPLIGKLFPPDKSVGFENLQFLLASAAIPKTDIELWGNEKLLPNTVTPIPTRDLSKGLGIDGKLNLGPLEAPVSLPLTGPDPTPAPSSPPQTVTPPSASDKAKWFTVQKKIGPIDFERVGLQYTNGELWFLLDASLSAGGLTIDLQGLSARSSLKRFDPKFSLNGLGIDFKRGPLEIGGAFLKVPNAGDNVQYEYDGTAIIKTEELMLAAIGSYAALADGHKSLFIYAVLDYPLGGPAFFFVTGLAAGFGYNRRLITPAIDQVASFPLVSEAMNGATPIPSGTGSREALSAELAKIRTYIPPEEDQYFFAVGIKFNSFKMIDSFALLTVSFGHHFELDLLGLSTLLLPTPEAGSSVEPLAEVQLALKASFIPDEGFLGVEAQLTTASFLLSRKCHLTGGFAFFSWFSGPHGGDFVISVGGYHPSFQKPAHYPSVPRVGFNWQVTDQLSLKGGAYFALTASAVMAGGRLQALWDDGNLKAWFVAGADFLIAWKPYHYDARIYVDLGVSYTFHFFGTHTISVDIGADLHIWGPDFSGTAHVKLWIISFTVSFGAGSSQAPRPINWTQFRTSFLPAANKDILSIALKGGLKKQVDAGNVDWIVDPKGLAFEVDSILPVKQVSLGAAAQKSSGQEAFGISPMGLNRSKVESTLKITITDKDPSTTAPQQLNDYTDKFSLVPIKKNVPKGMWGESVSPNLNGQKFITGAVTGYRIVLNAQEEEPTTKPDPIDRHKFEFSTKDMNGYIDQKVTSAFTPNYPEDWRNQLKQDLKSNSTRDTILTALGLTSESDSELVDSYVDELIFSPQFKGQAV